MYKARITGIGKYIPAKVLTNHDLEKMVETNDEWITTRTGIKERHIAAENETTSSMGAQAAEKALEMSGVKKEEIDMVIFATITPDKPFPASACITQNILKIPGAATVDIEAACTGFLYALSMAYAYITAGIYKNILIIGSETMSRFTDWTDRNTCVLFGDGAGAAVVSRVPDGDSAGIIGISLGGDGQYGDLLYVPGGGSAMPPTEDSVRNRMHYIKMAGNSVFKVAVRTMADTLDALMKEKNVHPDEVKLLIPHQANKRIIDAVAERLDFPAEKVMINLDKYANTSSATIPIAMEEAWHAGRIQKGDTIAMVAFGGGFTWGAALLKF